MKHTFRKSLAVAGILSCLFASAAFAEPAMITPEQDKATQEAALKTNKDFDKEHGYKNESAAEMKEEKKVEKEKSEAAAKNAAWEQDKETQAEAVKANQVYDAAHGYLK